MRLNKTLAALAATSVIASSVMAQDGFIVWGTIDGNYAANNGTNVTATFDQTNGKIVLDAQSAINSGATFVDIPLTFHLIPGAAGTISTWDSFAIRYIYDETKIDVAAAQEVSTGNFAPYFFSTFAGTGSQGTFTQLKIRTAPAAGINGLAAGQIYQDPASGQVDFAHAVAAGAGTGNPFGYDYNGSAEAQVEGIHLTRYSTTNNATTRVSWTLRVYLQNIGLFNSYSPTLRDQSLLSDGSRYPLGMNATVELVPEPASMIALGTGLAGLLALRRRRK